LFLARKAGAVPADATNETHGREREQFKVVSLGVLYGLSADGIAAKLGVPPCVGRDLLRMHRETFRRFWEWSDAVEADAVLTGKMTTVFGWTLHLSADVNVRSIRNFPMQAHGAEMLRFAASLATERNIGVCASIHDAFLVEADVSAIDGEVARMRDAMREASELVLPGFSLRTDAEVVRYPNRYSRSKV
jgi:DNA polymerase I-like protein with 3'-5' exonuclease and polymerase domains